MKTLGEKLKELRLYSNLTQTQLADLLSITKSTLSCYENNKRHPSYEVIMKIENLFNVSTDYLLGSSNNNMIDLSAPSLDNYNKSSMYELMYSCIKYALEIYLFLIFEDDILTDKLHIIMSHTLLFRFARNF